MHGGEGWGLYKVALKGKASSLVSWRALGATGTHSIPTTPEPGTGPVLLFTISSEQHSAWHMAGDQ